jgi:hypothetical protein
MKRHAAITLLFAAAILPFALAAQIGVAPVPPSWHTQQPGSSPTPTVHDSQPVEDPADAMRRVQFSKLNLKRQDQARADAAKLLALATDLKQQIDTASANTASAKVASTTDQIVKLAKSVKANSQPI